MTLDIIKQAVWLEYLLVLSKAAVFYNVCLTPAQHKKMQKGFFPVWNSSRIPKIFLIEAVSTVSKNFYKSKILHQSFYLNYWKYVAIFLSSCSLLSQACFTCLSKHLTCVPDPLDHNKFSRSKPALFSRSYIFHSNNTTLSMLYLLNISIGQPHYTSPTTKFSKS